MAKLRSETLPVIRPEPELPDPERSDSVLPGPELPPADAEAAEVLFALATTAVKHCPREMSLTAVSTLATLAHTGPRRITELALIERVTQPSMTALVSRLEDGGFVERCHDRLDKRAVLVALTENGLAYLQNQRQAGARTFAQLIGQLRPAEAEALTAALPALRRLRELDREWLVPSLRWGCGE